MTHTGRRRCSGAAHLFGRLVEDDLRVDEAQSVFELQLNLLARGHERVDQLCRARSRIVAGEQCAQLFRFALQRVDALANSLKKHGEHVRQSFVSYRRLNQFATCAFAAPHEEKHVDEKKQIVVDRWQDSSCDAP